MGFKPRKEAQVTNEWLVLANKITKRGGQVTVADLLEASELVQARKMEGSRDLLCAFFPILEALNMVRPSPGQSVKNAATLRAMDATQVVGHYGPTDRSDYFVGDMDKGGVHVTPRTEDDWKEDN